LAHVYRTHKKIAADKTITISLDGDVLDEDQTVKSLDLEEEDQLDVQID